MESGVVPKRTWSYPGATLELPWSYPGATLDLPWTNFDEDLFGTSRERHRHTRSQKQKERRRRAEATQTAGFALDISRDDLQTMQQEDETLHSIQTSRDKQASEPFFLWDGLLDILGRGRPCNGYYRDSIGHLFSRMWMSSAAAVVSDRKLHQEDRLWHL